MAIINKWRVIHIMNKRFLVALEVCDHPRIFSGPILTSEIIEGEAVPHGLVKTKSGTNYLLKDQLAKTENCEFARGLLVERVSRNFAKQGFNLNLDNFVKLNLIIDKILTNDSDDV